MGSDNALFSNIREQIEWVKANGFQRRSHAVTQVTKSVSNTQDSTLYSYYTSHCFYQWLLLT